MTRAEEIRLFVAHVRLAGDHWFDKLLCIRSFANRAKQRGNTFVYLQAFGANQ